MRKLKSKMALHLALQHNARTRIPPNADEKKTEKNWQTGTGTPDQRVDQALARYEALLPAKVRKNAVHAVEVILTASPTFKGTWTSYLNDCDSWVKELFGESSVLHIAHHKDEATLHSHVLVMPLRDGRLNAKSFIGGQRSRMADLQSAFFEKVGKKYALERGVSRAETKARHTPHSLEPLKERYETFDHARRGALGMWQVPESKTFESAKTFRARLEPEVLGVVALARQREREAASAKKAAEAEAQVLRDEKKKVWAMVETLTGAYGDVRQADAFIALKKLQRETQEREALAKAKAKKRAPPSYDGYER